MTTLAVGTALWLTLSSKTGRAGALLVLLAGLATLVVAFARQSCSTLQQECLERESAGAVSTGHVVHNLVALAAFAFLIAGGFLLTSGLRRDDRFRQMSRATRLVATGALVFAIWFGSAAYGTYGGIVQRVLVVLAYGLPMVLALRVSARATG